MPTIAKFVSATVGRKTAVATLGPLSSQIAFSPVDMFRQIRSPFSSAELSPRVITFGSYAPIEGGDGRVRPSRSTALAPAVAPARRAGDAGRICRSSGETN
jgi:hypothetical protein